MHCSLIGSVSELHVAAADELSLQYTI